MCVFLWVAAAGDEKRDYSIPLSSFSKRLSSLLCERWCGLPRDAVELLPGAVGRVFVRSGGVGGHVHVGGDLVRFSV